MITSITNPQVKEVVQLQTKPRARRDSGLFVAEGLRLVEEIPERNLVKAFFSEESDPRIRELAGRLHAEEVSENVLRKMSSTQTPQGIIAIVRKPEWSLDDIGGKTIMILEDIQDPGNLGTIIRTGEGAGIGGIIVTRGTADITNPKTVRSTMGSIFRVPFAVTDDIHETIRLLRQRGFSIYAAALESSIPYDEPDYTHPSAFLVGNEGNGLTAAARAEADKAVRIPMGGKVESLNAAIASAILMYEVRRQNKSFDGVS